MPFSNCFLSPPNVGNTYSSKWQSEIWTVNKFHFDNSRYFIIERELYPTYILNCIWEPIIVPFGGENIYTTLKNSYMRILGH